MAMVRRPASIVVVVHSHFQSSTCIVYIYTYFDAIIALKIGNRLAIIKIVKIIHVLMLFNFFLNIYIYIYILKK